MKLDLHIDLSCHLFLTKPQRIDILDIVKLLSICRAAPKIHGHETKNDTYRAENHVKN